MQRRVLVLLHLILLAAVAAGCATPTPVPTATPVEAVSEADLSAIKAYLLDKAGELKAATTRLQSASNSYYAMAEAAGFDYPAMWAGQPDEAQAVIEEARAAWIAASPLYEQVEGIVAGVPSLAEFDVILDAGASGAEDPEGAVPFDLTLPDGRVLPKPGNLFGVTESALWGTEPEYTVPDVAPDFDGNGAQDFGEALPDANVLKAGADALASYTADMVAAAEAWEPTEADAFTALVVMVPTMSEYFESWKNSRFVAGEAATQRDFVAISRLSDIQGILGSLQVVYTGVQPLVETVDDSQADQIATDLDSLKSFVAEVYAQEQEGKRFSAEEADSLGAEAQDRATSIAGQVSQAAARLNIPIEE